jgi:hypothetical protein
MIVMTYAVLFIPNPLGIIRHQASHLHLIHTNLGYGTVLTAACCRQGCSATDDDDYYYCKELLGNIPSKMLSSQNCLK